MAYLAATGEGQLMKARRDVGRGNGDDDGRRNFGPRLVSGGVDHSRPTTGSGLTFQVSCQPYCLDL
jgi:hypothetical protein